jgi:hypothetical protein
VTEVDTETLLAAHALYPVRSVPMVLRPGCSTKDVAAGRRGVVSAALLGSADFDVRDVVVASLGLHGAKSVGADLADVNHDSWPDLVVRFDLEHVRLVPSASVAHVRGWLRNSQVFVGKDRVRVVDRAEPPPTNCRGGGIDP